jgi:hypothetical protein
MNMIKHWKVNATKPDGGKIVLHAATSDELIAADLKLPQGKSLIREARRKQFRTEPFLNENDHFDLASEALQTHCHYQRWVFDGSSFTETAELLPDRMPDSAIGGDKQSFLVSIWIDSAED